MLWVAPQSRHHIAAKAERAAEHVGQQPLVLAGVVAVHAVVRAHHRAGVAALDRELEGEQVGHSRRRGVDLRIVAFAAGLQIVQRIMLGGRDDVVRLDAGDLRTDDGPGEQRVLAAIFEIAAVARVAQRDSTPPASITLKPDARASEPIIASALEGDVGVPGRRGRDAGGKRGALAFLRRAPPCVATPIAGVGLPLRRNSEPRNAGNVAGRADAASSGRLEIVLPVGVRGEPAEHEIEFFVLGQLLDDERGALLRAQRAVHPRARGARRSGRGRCRTQGKAATQANSPTRTARHR